jgi:transglutaminase-like putative cysteine protease
MVAIRTLTTALTYAISLCGVIPLLPWLATAPRIFLAIGFLFGIWQDRRGIWSLKPWMQHCIIVPIFIFYIFQYSRSNPIQPVVSVLTIMLSLRLSGEKTVRYSLQIQALSLFCLASFSLFDLSPIFLLYVGLLLVLVAMALVLLTFYNQDSDMRLSLPDLSKVLVAGLLLPLLSLPLMLLFFPILPRTQFPLWNFMSSTPALTTGLSDKVEPGMQSSVRESPALAFRAEMPRQASQPYWRAIVYNQITGNRWTRDRAVPNEKTTIRGRTVVQAIYPEPSDSKVLPTLDRPTFIAIRRSNSAPDSVFEFTGLSRKRLNYTVESVVEGIAVSGASINKPFYLRIPTVIPTRVKQFAADVRRSGKSDRARLYFLETYFRNGGYSYSTKNLPTGSNALESFLFEEKKGNCSFFASSFALLLRVAGVPCRLVGGYLGGDYNELGNYYLVSESMSHVWVEVFIDGSGWLRVDPSSFAVNAGNIFGDHKNRDIILRLLLLVDSLDHAWNRTIIPYDLERQINIFNSVGELLHDAESKKILGSIVKLLVFIAVCVGGIFAIRRNQFFRSSEERILRRFFLQAGLNFVADKSQRRTGLFEIANKSGNEKIIEFVNIYSGAVYRDRKLTGKEYQALKKMLREGFAK